MSAIAIFSVIVSLTSCDPGFHDVYIMKNELLKEVKVVFSLNGVKDTTYIGPDVDRIVMVKDGMGHSEFSFNDEYIYDMPLVMSAADLVVCRAGASTISELLSIAKPSVLVPSPNVTANHQEKNARVLSDRGAAVLLLENECGENTLYDTAAALLVDRRRREEIARELKEMASVDAGEKIFRTLVELMK